MRDEAQKKALIEALHLDPKSSDPMYWSARTTFSWFLGGTPIILNQAGVRQIHRVPTGVALLMLEVEQWLYSGEHKEGSVEDFAKALENIRAQCSKMGQSRFRHEDTQHLYNTPIKPLISHSDIIVGDKIEVADKLEHGSVFKATYKGTEVVLKKSYDKDNRQLLTDFKKIGQFDSPYVVYCYGICEAGLVLELMPLGSLKSYLHHPDNLCNQWFPGKIVWASDIINGLNYLHQQGIVHGNLNPKNILIDSDKRLKLSGFSLSQPIGQTCILAGSPMYMAPEIHVLMDTKEGHIQATFASDIFSYAAVLAELVSPLKFSALPDLAVALDFCQSSKKEFLIAPCEDERLQGIARDCWAPNPHERPTAQAIIERLNKDQDAPLPPPNSAPQLSR